MRQRPHFTSCRGPVHDCENFLDLRYQLYSALYDAGPHLDILCLARSLLIRVGQGHRLELYPDLHTVTWVLLLVTRLGVTWQMASLSGVIIRLHTEGGLAGLLK